VSDPWTIAAAAPQEWRAAFELALERVPEAERAARVLNALTLLAAGELEADGVLVARTARGLVGVQVAVPLRGAGGLVWLPRVAAAFAETALAEQLTRQALAWLRRRGARFAQALVDPQADAAALVRSGFRRITQLLYLRHDLAEVPQGPEPAWNLAPYDAASQDLFQATLQRTYEGTLDCPELNGRRTIAEALEGHRAQGLWQPGFWLLASNQEGAIGVLLLAELEDGGGWDLSYLGVTPEFRGRGWGRRLALHALRKARAADALQLTVAVDVRNAPALRIYESLGFERVQAKDVYLCFYDESAGVSRDSIMG
jgi:mycothiol synthase